MTQVRVRMLVIVGVMFVASGCGRKVPAIAPTVAPLAVVEEPPAAPLPIAEAPPAPSTPVRLSEEDMFARKTLDELNAEGPLGDVFFDFEQASIRSDARITLQTNAEWMQRWTSTQVRIEGHSDSRGTSEYNLALGERRATAVKDYLVSLGVEPARLLVVSKGEESPFCYAEDEECWQRNRRGHHVITGK